MVQGGYVIGVGPGEHHDATGGKHLYQHLGAGVFVGVLRHDVERLSGLLEHHVEPEPPVADHRQLGAQYGAARVGVANGLRPHPQDVVAAR
jgi:hypothetical protein